MNPNTIVSLRAQSLNATLNAARSRRIHRRITPIVISIAALMIVGFSLLFFHNFTLVFIEAEAPRSLQVIHTIPDSVTRITTREMSAPIRFNTDAIARVERIDNEGLFRCFPGKGIAIIHREGELPQVLFF